MSDKSVQFPLCVTKADRGKTSRLLAQWCPAPVPGREPHKQGRSSCTSSTALLSVAAPDKASIARKQTVCLQPPPRPGSTLCKQQHPRLRRGRQWLPDWCACRKRLLVQARLLCSALAQPSCQQPQADGARQHLQLGDGHPVLTAIKDAEHAGVLDCSCLL